MSQQVTITSVTGNTPITVYYCDSSSGSCVTVATFSSPPYTFTVPDPVDNQDYLIKIEDANGCVYGEFVYITPTPTSSVTPTVTPTPSFTPTTTQTPTVTPTNSVTPTTTVTNTPSQTASPTATPNFISILRGQSFHSSAALACTDIMTSTSLYCYYPTITPTIGVILYQTPVGATLFNPFNGNNQWVKMNWGGTFYGVQVDTVGSILSYSGC
jgi:hypothetical protein